MMKNRFCKKEAVFFISVLLIVFYFPTLFAGVTGKISGKVTDASNEEPLPGVNVFIDGTTMGASTDLEGDYFILNIPPGVYSLKAEMIGYASQTQTQITVNIDRTINIDFILETAILEGEGIVIIAQRDIIQKDVSASTIVAKSEQLLEVPFVQDVESYVNLQAGVSGWDIRGGSIDQTAFMMDGLTLVDNRANNQPIMMPNISSIKELVIIKGGFDAEYGNVRSGIVNIVTKEGSPNEYHGSFDLQIVPSRQKHGGNSIYDPDNYYLKSYLDPEVCWEGTKNGGWDRETQKQYPVFIGWNAVSERLNSDDDPTNDRTPEQCRDLFRWGHMVEGASELVPEGYNGPSREGSYGDEPDWNIDLGFGGPIIPGFDKLSFFVSHRSNREMFALPTAIDYYKENNTQLKLSYRISPEMKLEISGLYGETHSVSNALYYPNGDNDYTKDGEDIFWSEATLYWPSSLVPFDIYRNVLGISFNHVLSPKTFYNLRLTHTYAHNVASQPTNLRDTTPIRYFGNTPADESPYGWWPELVEVPGGSTGEWAGGWGAGVRDWSKGNTINFKGDLTSQYDKYNQIKFGVEVNYDDLSTHYESILSYSAVDNWKMEWNHYPIRAGAFLQDKIEFEGMVANIGVRLDYSNANADWYTVDRYSKYYSRGYKDVFTKEAPTAPAKSNLKFSPRFGISHPISDVGKIFFNYGHFYSMAPSSDLYSIKYGKMARGITDIGNASADLPRTIAYELGYDHNIANTVLLQLSGYYKDISNQTGWVSYTNFDASVDYSTIENNNYADIRGFEIKLEKRVGPWITGWINYDYMVTTSGYLGQAHYFQDARIQDIYKMQNPYQERPIARPVLRAAINFTTPKYWGPSIIGIEPFSNFAVNLLYSWRAGEWTTWDPLNTFELKDNLQWKAYSNFDLRLSKKFEFGGMNFNLFMDVHNLFNTKRLNTLGFADGTDFRRYMDSLHLPMYNEKKYQDAGFTGGNDKLGDIKSEDKTYIDMPNLKFLSFIDERYLLFGLRMSF